MDVRAVAASRRKELERKQAENALMQRQIDDKVEKMKVAAATLVLGQEALQFLEDVANSRRGAMRGRIEQIVSEALRIVYGPNYTVELTYDVKNNRSFMEIRLVVMTGVGEVKRTMEGFGGGVSDTISIPLRLLVLLGSRKTDLVCVLDEAYKHVGLDQIEMVAQFISEVSRSLGVQILLCSHHEVMSAAADAVFDVRGDNGRSIVVRA
jgi:DNA repair exonuclease SbcCD ATPase subunit